jgi:enoyl-CoA hydratase/carnithine racemase
VDQLDQYSLLEVNIAASQATAEAVERLNRLPVPTVALVQGACFGGGTGIVAACDVVIAAEDAIFSIAEVRWGLTAAIILPQLADAISVRQLRRYALTAERFGAAEAHRIGLVHVVVPGNGLAAAGEEMLARLLENGPIAMTETKAGALQSAWGGFSRETLAALVESHASKRRLRSRRRSCVVCRQTPRKLARPLRSRAAHCLPWANDWAMSSPLVWATPGQLTMTTGGRGMSLVARFGTGALRLQPSA